MQINTCVHVIDIFSSDAPEEESHYKRGLKIYQGCFNQHASKKTRAALKNIQAVIKFQY